MKNNTGALREGKIRILNTARLKFEVRPFTPVLSSQRGKQNRIRKFPASKPYIFAICRKNPQGPAGLRMFLRAAILHLPAYPCGKIPRARDRSGIRFGRLCLPKRIIADSPVRPKGLMRPNSREFNGNAPLNVILLY
jgi:hypothetical protein